MRERDRDREAERPRGREAERQRGREAEREREKREKERETEVGPFARTFFSKDYDLIAGMTCVHLGASQKGSPWVVETLPPVNTDKHYKDKHHKKRCERGATGPAPPAPHTGAWT